VTRITVFACGKDRRPKTKVKLELLTEVFEKIIKKADRTGASPRQLMEGVIQDWVYKDGEQSDDIELPKVQN